MATKAEFDKAVDWAECNLPADQKAEFDRQMELIRAAGLDDFTITIVKPNNGGSMYGKFPDANGVWVRFENGNLIASCLQGI